MRLLFGIAETIGAIWGEDAVPYTPPWRQIDALSAGEILLRGADEPAATPEELLRAAHEAKETDSEELLRANETLRHRADKPARSTSKR